MTVTAETMKKFICEKVEPDLTYIWDTNDVPLEVQHTIAVKGLVKVRTFAAIGDSL